MINRAIVDTGIVGEGISKGVKGVYDAIRTRTPIATKSSIRQIPENIRTLRTNRGRILDTLDENSQRWAIDSLRKKEIANPSQRALKVLENEIEYLPQRVGDRRFRSNFPEYKDQMKDMKSFVRNNYPDAYKEAYGRR